MDMKHQRRNERGQALMEVLIATGILMVMMATTFSMLQSQSQETRALSQKINAIEMQRTLTQLMADSSVCQSMITRLPAPHLIQASLTPAQLLQVRLPMPNIPSSAAPTALPLLQPGVAISEATAPDLVVATDGIYFDQLKPTGTANQYQAELKVAFDTRQLVRPIRPLSLRFTLTADPTTRRVNGCVSTGGGGTNTTITNTSPGGKCTTIRKEMIKGAPDVQFSGYTLKWSGMRVQCPEAFPVALSGMVTSSDFAAGNLTDYTQTNPGYFDGINCGVIYYEDSVYPSPGDPTILAYPHVRRALCAVTCCNL